MKTLMGDKERKRQRKAQESDFGDKVIVADGESLLYNMSASSISQYGAQRPQWSPYDAVCKYADNWIRRFRGLPKLMIVLFDGRRNEAKQHGPAGSDREKKRKSAADTLRGIYSSAAPDEKESEEDADARLDFLKKAQKKATGVTNAIRFSFIKWANERNTIAGVRGRGVLGSNLGDAVRPHVQEWLREQGVTTIQQLLDLGLCGFIATLRYAAAFDLGPHVAELAVWFEETTRDYVPVRVHGSFYESDAQLVSLVKQGVADVILTSDSDVYWYAAGIPIHQAVIVEGMLTGGQTFGAKLIIGEAEMEELRDLVGHRATALAVLVGNDNINRLVGNKEEKVACLLQSVENTSAALTKVYDDAQRDGQWPPTVRENDTCQGGLFVAAEQHQNASFAASYSAAAQQVHKIYRHHPVFKIVPRNGSSPRAAFLANDFDVSTAPLLPFESRRCAGLRGLLHAFFTPPNLGASFQSNFEGTFRGADDVADETAHEFFSLEKWARTGLALHDATPPKAADGNDAIFGAEIDFNHFGGVHNVHDFALISWIQARGIRIHRTGLTSRRSALLAIVKSEQNAPSAERRPIISKVSLEAQRRVVEGAVLPALGAAKAAGDQARNLEVSLASSFTGILSDNQKWRKFVSTVKGLNVGDAEHYSSIAITITVRVLIQYAGYSRVRYNVRVL